MVRDILHFHAIFRNKLLYLFTPTFEMCFSIKTKTQERVSLSPTRQDTLTLDHGRTV